MLGPFVEALFPKRCAGCGAGPWPFCDRCRALLSVLAPPWCHRCGAPATPPVGSCRDCPPPSITRSRAPFLFDGPIRRSVHRLKFAGWRPVAQALAAAMSEAWGADAAGGPDVRTDVVTWVPLSRRRLAERGYDQARVLALAVAPRLGLPTASLLRRATDAGSQARRGAQARREAMRGVFAPAGRPAGRVLLVDDVLTTGSTAAACAEVLLAAGAAEVSLLTAARALNRPGRGPILDAGPVSGSVVARGVAPR